MVRSLSYRSLLDTFFPPKVGSVRFLLNQQLDAMEEELEGRDIDLSSLEVVVEPAGVELPGRWALRTRMRTRD